MCSGIFYSDVQLIQCVRETKGFEYSSGQPSLHFTDGLKVRR